MSGEISLEQLGAALNHAAVSIDREVAPVVKRTMNRVADTQRHTVRKRSHETERSIEATGPDGAPFGPTTIDGEAGPTWFVGRLLERGAAGRGPFPFVATSLAPHMAAHEREIADAALYGALKGLTR